MSHSPQDVHKKVLGKKGEITAILKQMGSLSPEERPIMGALVNEAKQELEELIAIKKDELKAIYVLGDGENETVEVKGKELALNRLHIGNRDTKGVKR